MKTVVNPIKYKPLHAPDATNINKKVTIDLFNHRLNRQRRKVRKTEDAVDFNTRFISF